jgi:probable rRNA maturation factor
VKPSLPVSFTLLKFCRTNSGAFSVADLESLAGFVLAQEGYKGEAALTLAFTTPARIRSLNRRFRGVDRITDVIAFCQNRRPLEGDIAINLPQAAIQAREMRHPTRHEIRLLLVHGILHLLGYTDYEEKARRRMFRRQNGLLRCWERRVK